MSSESPLPAPVDVPVPLDGEIEAVEHHVEVDESAGPADSDDVIECSVEELDALSAKLPLGVSFSNLSRSVVTSSQNATN